MSYGSRRRVVSQTKPRHTTDHSNNIQASFEPTFSCTNTSTILNPGCYYSSYLPAYEDGKVFRNVGIENSDAGELPRRKHTAV
jgi:hypothetical protein